MTAQSISLGFQFCQNDPPKQTTFSCPLRITCVVLGILSLTVGALMLTGVPGLNQLGTIPGYFFLIGGGLLSLAGICLKCVLNKSHDQKQESIIDPQIEGFYSQCTTWTSAQGIEMTMSTDYISLKSFLTSQKAQDEMVIDDLKDKLHITDLSARLWENFGIEDVNIALRTQSTNNVRDNEDLLETLKLIFMAKQELLELHLQDHHFSDYAQNLIALRLKNITVSQNQIFSDGTLGYLLTQKDQDLLSIDSKYYCWFTVDQVKTFLELPQEITEDSIKALFPYNERYIFTSNHTWQILQVLPGSIVNKILAKLSPALVVQLMQKRQDELDYTLLTEGQVRAMFPTNWEKEEETKKLIEHLPIGRLNQILVKMDGPQLQRIPLKHLQDKRLNLKSLNDHKIKGMFPTNWGKQEETFKLIKQLPKENYDFVLRILKKHLADFEKTKIFIF